MKGWVGYVLLAISLVVAFQGFQNVRNEASTEALAKAGACDVDSQCLLKDEEPDVVNTDVFQRRYQWRTTIGPVTSVCRRDWIFFGGWSCRSERGEI
jgi:hypothetical protein